MKTLLSYLTSMNFLNPFLTNSSLQELLYLAEVHVWRGEWWGQEVENDSGEEREREMLYTHHYTPVHTAPTQYNSTTHQDHTQPLQIIILT